MYRGTKFRFLYQSHVELSFTFSASLTGITFDVVNSLYFPNFKCSLTNLCSLLIISLATNINKSLMFYLLHSGYCCPSSVWPDDDFIESLVQIKCSLKVCCVCSTLCCVYSLSIVTKLLYVSTIKKLIIFCCRITYIKGI